MEGQAEQSKSRFFSVKDGTVFVQDPAAPQEVRPYKLPSGIVDKKYRILNLLGEGGMGAVFRAHHLMLDKDVALKTFRSASQSEEERLRFQREAQALAKLTHKNIVQVFDFGLVEDGSPYYTMEFLAGEPLAERIRKKGRLPVEEAIDFFIPVCHGLALAHSKGIIHRDLKPSNLFIEHQSGPGAKAEAIKIVDFGIASLQSHSPDSQRLTTIGTIFGSPLYMSPEQSLGQEITERADIYSLGCALFETLTGKPPFQGSNSLETIMMHHKDRPPTMAQVCPEESFSPVLESVVAKMLSKDPQRRHASMDQLAASLNQFVPGVKSGTARTIKAPSPNAAIFEIGTGRANQDTQDTTASRRGVPAWPIQIAVAVIALGLGAGLVFALRGNIWPAHSQTKDESTEAPVPKPVEASRPEDKAVASVDGPPAIKRSEFVAGGHKWIALEYPLNMDIGGFRIRPEDERQIRKEKAYSWRADQPPIFQPSVEFMANPNNLSVFKPDDLKGLDLIGCHPDQINLDLIKRINRLTGLRVLNFDDCATFDETEMQGLTKLDKLEHLSLSRTNVRGEALARWPGLRQLSFLGFSGCPQVSAVLKALRGNPKIRGLYLKYDPFTDEDVKTIATLPNLDNLNANDSLTKMSQIPYLVPLKKLRTLEIADCRVDASIIPVLRIMAKNGLQKIGFSNNGISTEDKLKIKKIVPMVWFYQKPEDVNPNLIKIDDWRDFSRDKEQ